MIRKKGVVYSMEGPRAAKISELPLIEKLSNMTFKRAEDEQGQSMFDQFPELFSVENIENIRVIIEDGTLVSNINYVIRPVSIHGCIISTASLGAVATSPEYRRRGYATALLHDCIARMESQGAHVLLISGDRSIYRNVGSMPAGEMYAYLIDSSCNFDRSLYGFDDHYSNYTIREIDMEKCSDEDFTRLAELYRKENVRFVRKYDEFKELLLSRKHLPKIKDMKRVIAIGVKDEFAAYMYLSMKEDKNAVIYDCAGSKELILKTCIKLVKDNVFQTVRGNLMTYHTQAVELCKACNININKRRLTGTVKIIDFAGFMNALRQYFYEVCGTNLVDKIEFINGENGAVFKLEKRKCIVTCKEKLNNLIFGGSDVFKEDFAWEREDSRPFSEADYKDFTEFFGRVFPIPFVDPSNLNFI